jgi:caa(3)-type oxidase subunit IV
MANAHAADAHGHDHGHGADDHGHAHHPNYWQIWALLCALLFVSVAGPFLGIRIVTLIAAFGIAVVKAYFVVRYFMHIDIAAKYVTYFIVTALVFMFLFFAGTAPDVMKPQGRNWEKPVWLDKGSIVHQSAPPAEGEEGHSEHE